MIRELIQTPREYFSERIKYPQLRMQSIFVALAGLLTGVWRLGVHQDLGAAVSYIEDVLIILMFLSIAEFFLWWIFLTILMVLIANGFGGDATIGGLLRLTGYGFLPLMLSGAIWSIGHYLALQGATPPEPPLHAGFQYQYTRYDQFMEQAAGEPFLLGALAFGTLFVLAAGYFWYHAVAVAAEVENNYAGLAAGIAVAIFLGRFLIPAI